MGLLTRSASAPVTAEQVHEARQRHYEEEQQAQMEREKARRKAEWDARQREDLQRENRRQQQQTAFAVERDRLRRELVNAEHARASVGAAIDLSTEEAAVRSIDRMTRQAAAEQLVVKAKAALDAHKPRL